MDAIICRRCLFDITQHSPARFGEQIILPVSAYRPTTLPFAVPTYLCLHLVDYPYPTSNRMCRFIQTVPHPFTNLLVPFICTPSFQAQRFLKLGQFPISSAFGILLFSFKIFAAMAPLLLLQLIPFVLVHPLLWRVASFCWRRILIWPLSLNSLSWF